MSTYLFGWILNRVVVTTFGLLLIKSVDSMYSHVHSTVLPKKDGNRLYQTLDQLLPHKEKLEIHLKNRLGELFDLEYDLLMYDITSTYFEGQANFDLAQRGYSRDQRSDCKQVCIGLVVSRCGMPLGYEVFAGNTADVTTVEHIVETLEKRYGKSDRIWVMDRDMVSEDNIDFLREGGLLHSQE